MGVRTCMWLGVWVYVCILILWVGLVLSFLGAQSVSPLYILCRFGGSTFPPTVLFKVFIGMRGQGVKYINGRKMIKPSSEVSSARRGS